MKSMMNNYQKLSVSCSNLIVELNEYAEKLKSENQKLRDEISLMKGEQPKPDIKLSRKRLGEDISPEEIREIGGKGVYVLIGHTSIGLTGGVFHYIFESQV